MPAQSKSQANLFKVVYGYKKGFIKPNDMPESLEKKVKDIADSISTDDARDLMRQEDMLIKQKDRRGIVDPEDDDQQVILDKALRELKMEIRMLYENNQKIKKFFKKPEVNKGYTTLKRLWQQGGEDNENVLYTKLPDISAQVSALFNGLLNMKEFNDFLKREEYAKDLNPTFMKSLSMYFSDVAKIKKDSGEVEERELTYEDLENIYNSLNKYKLYVFVEAIMEYRKRAFKEPVINS